VFHFSTDTASQFLLKLTPLFVCLLKKYEGHNDFLVNFLRRKQRKFWEQNKRMIKDIFSYEKSFKKSNLASFHFCYMHFLMLRHEQKNVKNSGALEPNGSQVNSSL